MSNFSIDDYITVAERITAFYKKHPEGSIQSELVELSESRVVMRAYAYRTPSDERPGIGYSSLGIPGRTPYTKDSEIENCESSAWGRAIAALGFEVKRGIASRDEVQNKQGEPAPKRPAPVGHDAGGLVGNAQVGTGKSDFELRQEPDGWVISFKLVQGRQGIKVVAHGPLAQAIATLRPTIEGKTVTCWGSVSEESFKKDGREIKYRVLTLSRIQTPDGTLPAPEPGLEEPPDDVELAVA